MSDTQADCTAPVVGTDQKIHFKVTLDGTKLTALGQLTNIAFNGTLIGGNLINFENGAQWKKEEQGNQNIVCDN